MQASNAQPQTPMLSAPRSSVMDTAFRKLVRNEELRLQGRESNNQITRLALEVEQINNSMKIMQDEMRRDIRARRKYFLEEQKLRREESKELQKIRTAALFDIRAAVAAGSGLLALKEFSEGDIGGGLQAAGVGIAALAPEITDLVISILAAKGLMGGGRGIGIGGGGRGLGAAGLLRNIGGKKGLFLIAALAASLLGGQLLGGGGNDADVRRLRETRKQVTGANLINESDVDRFRGQLNRFERILDDIGTTPTKRRQTRTSQREVEDIEQSDLESRAAQTNELSNAMSKFGGEITEGVKTKNEQDGGQEVKVDQDTSNLEAAAFSDDGMSDREIKRLIELEDQGIFGDEARQIIEEEKSVSPLSRLIRDSFVPLEGVTSDVIGQSGMFEGDDIIASTFAENLSELVSPDVKGMKGKLDDDFIDKDLGIRNPFKSDKPNTNREILDDNNTNKNQVEAFDLSGAAANNNNGKPTIVSDVVDSNIFVDTNFESDTGSIFDKLDSKSSYKTYGAYD